MAKKIQVDTPWQGSWAHEESTRPKGDRTGERNPVLIKGIVLYPCDKNGNRICEKPN